MKIAVGSDHAGFEIKEKVIQFLNAKGYETVDCGTYSKDSCDYPVFGKTVANKVASGECERGVLICTTGEGIMMAANKVKGIRCGIGYNDEATSLIRMHNNANIVSFGAKFMDADSVLRRVDIFLNTEFLGERHLRRVELIEK